MHPHNRFLPRGPAPQRRAIWAIALVWALTLAAAGQWPSASRGVASPALSGRGDAGPATAPGGRIGAVSWRDAGGTRWLFGGGGYDGSGTLGALNDLWAFDGAAWSWVSGSNRVNAPGFYGVQGTPAAIAVPGARHGAVSWVGARGSLWLFGGSEHNDLWKFDPQDGRWTWVAGSDAINAAGVYGTQGVGAPDNGPGARSYAVAWSGPNGALWLFGGSGCDRAGIPGWLNDLWKFDGARWSWVSGSRTVDVPGVYGNRGVPDSGNVPGARDAAVSWSDPSGNLWLFGGYNGDYFNDLWKFDGTRWTWVSGSSMANARGVYGARGVAAADNVPGARDSAVSWSDADGTLWLFGGNGWGGAGSFRGNLNDLWKFDGARWTWVSGSRWANAPGVYGTRGVAAAGNVPGARQMAVSWVGAGGDLWLFGGYGLDAHGTLGYLNDLWQFDGHQWAWVAGRRTADSPGVYVTQQAGPEATPGLHRGAVSPVAASLGRSYR